MAHRTVVAPVIGVADLVHHAVQLFERLLLGRVAHPGELVKVGLHGLFDLTRHGDRAGFGLGGECLFDEHLPKGFAEVPIHAPHAALPARFHLLHAAQVLAVEIEIRGHERLAQVGRAIVHQVPAQIRLPIGDGARLDQFFDLGEELGLGDVDHRRRGQADGLANIPARRNAASASPDRRATTCGTGCMDRAARRASATLWPARFRSPSPSRLRRARWPARSPSRPSMRATWSR